MELHEALTQISAIRQQLARSEQFRGYRAVPTAMSGMLAIGAGVVQWSLIPNAMEQLGYFLTLWICVAIVSLTICLGDVWIRYRRSAGVLQREVMHLALEQFFPCLIAGALLTLVIGRFAPQSAWMLPGLWAILFSLGLFASWRLLPKAMFVVAVYFLAGGSLAIALGSGPDMLSALQMPLLFGVGQLLAASVLCRSEIQRTGELS